MKRTLVMISAVLVAATANLGAQSGAIGELFSGGSRSVTPTVSGPAAVGEPVAAKQTAGREWLVLVFLNGVNDLGIRGFADGSVNAMEKVGSSDNMAVLVEYGILGQDGSPSRNLKFQRGPRTLHIKRDSDAGAITSPVIYAGNDADMGSAASLVRFVKRGIRRFPARKTAVILWNHGGGRLGISYDDVSKNHMEVDKLGLALDEIKEALGHKIDVFATDACLMQMAGVAYEFRNSADVIVGSEEIVPDDSYPYEAILERLRDNAQMGAEELGAVMVDAYGSRYHGADATLSALRSSALPGFVARLDSWVGAVKADPAAFRAAASKGVVSSAYEFAMGDSKDLYDYIDKVNGSLSASPAVKNAGDALKTYLTTSLIIRDTALPSMSKAHGLAIYIPDLRYNSANYEKLLFARDSQWDDFLRDIMEERLK